MWFGGAGLIVAVERQATVALPEPWDHHTDHDPLGRPPTPRKAIAQRLQDRRSRADPYLGIPSNGSFSLLRREGRPVSDLDTGEIVWRPDPAAAARARVARFIAAHGLGSLAALQRRS